MYGNWVPIHETISSWLLFTGSIIVGIDLTIAYAMKALSR